jgi:hypothetical protein
MTKEVWVRHIESISGIAAPSNGGDSVQWKVFVAAHKPDCKECKARAKTLKATASRKLKDSIADMCGLTKVRGAVSGRVYYE